jgi:hypothetical protein
MEENGKMEKDNRKRIAANIDPEIIKNIKRLGIEENKTIGYYIEEGLKKILSENNIYKI